MPSDWTKKVMQNNGSGLHGRRQCARSWSAAPMASSWPSVRCAVKIGFVTAAKSHPMNVVP